MKTSILTAIAVIGLTLSLTPAMAGEGNGEPFRNNATNLYTNPTTAQVADTGSNAFPSLVGRPGSNLPQLAGDVLPTNGSQGPVQTANSLPTNFEVGTVAYAQANSVRNWMEARAAVTAARYAATRTIVPGG